MADPAPGPGPAAPPLTESRDFWVLMAFALGLGVFGAFASLAFLGLLEWGNNWWSVSDVGWGGGKWWWVAVTAGAGLVVGFLHWAMRLPESTPGLIEDIDDEHVDARQVPGIVAVSLASLIGGASLGPEKPLGALGGGLGGWLSHRWHRDADDSRVNTLSGFGGAYGGLISSPVVVVALIMEIARPGGRQGAKALAGTALASSVSFGIYFAIAGTVFFDAFAVPHYEYRSWQLLAAVAFGLLAAVATTVLVLIVKVVGMLFSRLKLPGIAKSALGGAIFGLIGVALPLTMFTGTDQLKTVIAEQGTTLGLGILIAIVVAKMLSFAVSLGSGFVGGPIFAAAFMGGTIGTALHVAIPGIPLGLAVSCMLLSIVAALVSAPFTAVLFAAFTTQVGALQSAPILITAITAYLAMGAVKYALASRMHSREHTAAEGPPPHGAAVTPTGGAS